MDFHNSSFPTIAASSSSSPDDDHSARLERAARIRCCFLGSHLGEDSRLDGFLNSESSAFAFLAAFRSHSRNSARRGQVLGSSRWIGVDDYRVEVKSFPVGRSASAWFACTSVTFILAVKNDLVHFVSYHRSFMHPVYDKFEASELALTPEGGGIHVCLRVMTWSKGAVHAPCSQVDLGCLSCFNRDQSLPQNPFYVDLEISSCITTCLQA